jgi:hypothetical protein
MTPQTKAGKTLLQLASTPGPFWMNPEMAEDFICSIEIEAAVAEEKAAGRNRPSSERHTDYTALYECVRRAIDRNGSADWDTSDELAADIAAAVWNLTRIEPFGEQGAVCADYDAGWQQGVSDWAAAAAHGIRHLQGWTLSIDEQPVTARYPHRRIIGAGVVALRMVATPSDDGAIDRAAALAVVLDTGRTEEADHD